MKKLSVVVLVLLFVSIVTFGQSNGWTDDGSVVRLITSSDKVGIKTSTPKWPLTIGSPHGSVWHGHNLVADKRIGVYGSHGTGASLGSTPNFGEVYAYNYSGGGGKPLILNRYGGNVGIGTTEPSKKLEVNGDVRIGSKLEVNDDINVEAGPDDDDADIILTDATGKFGWIAQDKLSGAMWVEHAEGQRLMLSGQYGEEGTVVVKGVLGVGTDDPQSELAVNGTITAKEVIVTTDGWPDFVFSDKHKLMPLNKLEKHIKINKSLPGIPTEKEVLEGGVKLGDMQAKLLEKVEELTLYVIELKKENEDLKKHNENLENRISALER